MKTYTDELTPVDSATAVFSCANWLEREVSEPHSPGSPVYFVVYILQLLVEVSICMYSTYFERGTLSRSPTASLEP